MRFTVTPLGGARTDLPGVVDGIVRYLQPPTGTPVPASSGDSTGPSRYYADSAEEPGRWLGVGADHAGLRGTVRSEDFAAVLSGREPHTGARLITAQGSAGRRADLGAGNHTRTNPTGEAIYGEADAAAALGVTRAEVSRMLDVGTGIALSQLVPGPAGVPEPVPDPVPDPAFPLVGASYLVPVIDPDGTRWVSEAELSRCQDARAECVTPQAIASAGLGTDEFPIAEAARLAGVTAQYLRTLAKHYEDRRPQIDAALAAGRAPRRAYLVARRDDRGRWFVTRAHLAEFLERRRPPAMRVGFDLTLTTEKSLGVLALLSDPTTGGVVLDAIQQANDWAMTWLERHAAHARVTGHQVDASGWTLASFRHLTSRALDPFPHHHNVVANTVTLPDGTRRALDARHLYRHAHAASALATAEMRHQLTTRLGVRWRPGRHGGWEIDGIPDDVLVEFSQRRNEIDDALAELEDAIGRGAHPAELEHIVLRTRPPKTHTPAADLTDRWRQRAAAHGFDTTATLACVGHDTTTVEPDIDALFASLAGPAGICAGGSVFTRGDAVAALANHPVPTDDDHPQPLLVGAARLETLVDDFLASPHVVQVGGNDGGLFTTVEILAVQERIVSRFRKGLHHGAGLVNTDRIATALDTHHHLTREQQALVASWCGSGHRFQTAVGRAGAGKTTTVAACAESWTAAGYKVLGAAVKGEAARTLAAATGIPCETVAWYLTHHDPAHLPLDARTILVIDEASTLADRDLDALMTMAATTGAALRLIGDPAQHGAVAAGGMFRVLCERHATATPQLNWSHRVQDPHDRAAAEALRDGRIDDAFDHLEAAGHLHVVGDELAAHREILARWWDAHRAGHDHPMIDRRNTTRHQLNRLAHQLLQANGEVGIDEIIASGDRRFSVGDRVTARTPNRRLHPYGNPHGYVRNGALGTITTIHHAPNNRADDTITVAFDDIGTIELPRNFFDHHRTSNSGRIEVGIDHAYALTSYAVQGSTSAVSTSRIDTTTSRAETYVDITRGRRANHLYLTTAAGSLDAEALPRIPAPPTDQAVANRLGRSTGELTAWEIAHADPAQTRRHRRTIGL